MTYLECILPVVLLILLFLLRIVVDREVTFAHFITNVLELPQDVVFLALGFVVAFTIAAGATGGSGEPTQHDNQDIVTGLVTMIAFIIVLALTIFMSKRAVALFDRAKVRTTFYLGSISYLLCIPTLVCSIIMIVRNWP